MEIQQSNKFTLTKQNLDSSRFLEKTSRQIQFYTWVAIVLSHKPLLLMMMMYFRQCLFKFIQIFRLRYDAFKDGGIYILQLPSRPIYQRRITHTSQHTNKITQCTIEGLVNP